MNSWDEHMTIENLLSLLLVGATNCATYKQTEECEKVVGTILKTTSRDFSPQNYNICFSGATTVCLFVL